MRPASPSGANSRRNRPTNKNVPPKAPPPSIHGPNQPLTHQQPPSPPTGPRSEKEARTLRLATNTFIHAADQPVIHHRLSHAAPAPKAEQHAPALRRRHAARAGDESLRSAFQLVWLRSRRQGAAGGPCRAPVLAGRL